MDQTSLPPWSEQTDRPKRHRRLPAWARWLSWLLLAALGLTLILGRTPEDSASCQGRNVAEWFADYMALPPGQWNSSPLPEPTRAFIEIEGDAVRFLARQAGRRPGPLRRIYARAFLKLPAALRAVLPKPRPDPREAALRLLGTIGQIQKTKAWNGKPSDKPSARLSVPAVRTALHDSALRPTACQVIEDIGPAAKDALPDLLALAAADYTNRTVDAEVIRAVAELGPSASNAVPLLTQILADKTVSGRTLAARALSGIGAPARPAGWIVGALLAEQGDREGIGLLTVLARIGGAPDEAVPVLRDLVQHGPPLQRELATIAIWDREPNNEDLREGIKAALRAPLARRQPQTEPTAQDARFVAGQVLATLACHGTNATVFAPAIRHLLDSGDSSVSSLTNLAARVLEQIEPERPAQ